MRQLNVYDSEYKLTLTRQTLNVDAKYNSYCYNDFFYLYLRIHDIMQLNYLRNLLRLFYFEF